MPRAPLYDDDDMAAMWQQGHDEGLYEGRQTAFLEVGEQLERLRLGHVTLDEPDVTDRGPSELLSSRCGSDAEPTGLFELRPPHE